MFDVWLGRVTRLDGAHHVTPFRLAAPTLDFTGDMPEMNCGLSQDPLFLQRAMINSSGVPVASEMPVCE